MPSTMENPALKRKKVKFQNHGVTYKLETVQDFLINLDIKPLMHPSVEDKHFSTK